MAQGVQYIGRDYLLQQDPKLKRRFDLAEALGKDATSTAPISSHLQGIAKLLQAGLGAYTTGEAESDLAERQAAANQTILEAVTAGQGGNRDALIQALAGNADTAPMALNAQLAQLIGGAGSSPAAIQIANEVQKARAAGDMQRVNDLMMSAKMLDKGLFIGGGGNIGTMGGYADALGELSYGKQTGKNVSDLQYKPKIAGDVKTSQLRAEAGENLDEQFATLPQLMDIVDKLSELGKTATYTTAGRGYDVARKELGMEPTQGAVNRTEYISRVDNQILPLLRQTFGAQFTQKEGESLKVTLGDPNKTPEEKDAVLRAFIEQKVASTRAGAQRLGRQDILESPLLNVKPQVGSSEDVFNIPDTVPQTLTSDEQAELDALRKRFGKP